MDLELRDRVRPDLVVAEFADEAEIPERAGGFRCAQTVAIGRWAGVK